MSNIFYVYSLHVNNRPLPFYIGKGKHNRKEQHTNEALALKSVCGNRRTIKQNKILKEVELGNEINYKIILDNLSENEAFELEEHIISTLGRIDLGTGFLTNMSNGGEGNAGCKWKESSKELIRDRTPWNKGIPHSQQTKEKISKANSRPNPKLKGRAISENVRKAFEEANKNRVVSEETRDKIRKAHKGKPKPWMVGKTASDETKEKMANKRKGKKRFANYKKLEIIYRFPEEIESLEDYEDWFQWVPAYGFRDKELRAKYPKSLFYPQSD